MRLLTRIVSTKKSLPSLVTPPPRLSRNPPPTLGDDDARTKQSPRISQLQRRHQMHPFVFGLFCKKPKRQVISSQTPNPPSSVWIQPWSLRMRRSECRWRAMAATMPGTPATVSRNVMRLQGVRRLDLHPMDPPSPRRILTSAISSRSVPRDCTRSTRRSPSA